MKISDLFKNKRVLSFEVFPPKSSAPMETIFSTLSELKDLNPDFISVTFGAGGGTNCNSTVQIASAVKNNYCVESVAHLPCLSLSKEEVLVYLDQLREAGIENILALRGDRNPHVAAKDDFKYASDLVSFIKNHGDFHIIGACYPEGHKEANNLMDDIYNLKKKIDAGADQLISQLFFDNRYFYAFREKADHAGIKVPIEAGIMPVTNKQQIERMVSLCGVNLPHKFIAMMDQYWHHPLALRDAGIAYAVDQIVDLLAQGVDGIHLYTMNNPYIAKTIYKAVHRLMAA